MPLKSQVTSKPAPIKITPPTKLQELLEKIEISLIKKIGSKKFSIKSIMLFNGLNIANEQTGIPSNVYKFELPDDVKISTEDTVRFSIKGKDVAAEVASIDNQFILIKFAAPAGEKIAELKLEIDSSAIPKKLLERILKIKTNVGTKPETYQLTNNLLSPEAQEKSAEWGKKIILADGYNVQQRKALEISLNSKVSFVWGPPGTGKTKTLGAIAFNLMQGGKKILFASNTNRAVDNGVLAVVKQLISNNSITRKR